MLHLQVVFMLIICFYGVNSADSSSEHCETDFNGMNRNDIIEHYFHKGFLHKEISSVLLTLHAITASTRIVKRVLKARGCLRRNAANREVYEAAVRFTLEQLACSGQCLG